MEVGTGGDDHDERGGGGGIGKMPFPFAVAVQWCCWELLGSQSNWVAFSTMWHEMRNNVTDVPKLIQS